MNPFFFGESKSPLFGLYQSPAAGQPRGSGFVLSPAIGHEYLPAWPAFRELARSLSIGGHHVLRFDFTGQGDSGGHTKDATLEIWRRDLDLALSELMDLASIARAGIVGLRLGASIAALAGAERGTVERLILWEPVVSGVDFVSELAATRQAYLRRILPRPKRAMELGPPLDVMGFVVGEELQRSLLGLDLLKLVRRPAAKVTLMWREPSARTLALAAHLTSLGSEVRECLVPSPALWEKNAGLGEARVPVDVIRTVVEEAAGGSR